MHILEFLAPYLLFCIVMTATPGPNNALVLATGVRVGMKRSVPLVLGIAFGVGVLLAAVGLGLSAAFQAVPALHTVLKGGGVIYLVWLAYKIATSGPIEADTEGNKPLGFWGGVAFQWINPKTYAIATSAVAAYLPNNGDMRAVVAASMVLSFVALFGVGIWAAFGTAMRHLLTDPGKARWFNYGMAALLVVSAVPIIVLEHPT